MRKSVSLIILNPVDPKLY